MRYYRTNKKTGRIEIIDSDTGRAIDETPEVKEPEPVKVEEKIEEGVKPIEEVEQVQTPSPVPSAQISERKNNKTLIIVIIVCTLINVCAFAGTAFLLTRNNSSGSTTVKEKQVEEKVDETKVDYKQLWKDNKAINSDYVGQLVFESGLINQPVVQGETNEKYFRTNWKDMSHDEEGTVFMDYRNEPDDQNTILYGHYVYPSYETDTLGLKEAKGDRMFTPLAKLKDKANYEANKYVDLYLENEVIRYEVAVVYHCTLDPEVDYVSPIDTMYYSITNYDEEYFETYKKAIYDAAFYQTGVDISYNDKLLTLQTCVEGHDELLEIVVCKEISRKTY